MRTPRTEVGDVLVQHPLEVALVDDEEMIQRLGPRGSDSAFGERVRPRCLRRCPELSHPESSQAPIKRFAIPAVPVTEEIPRRIPVPTTGVHDLLGRPVGGGVSGHPHLPDLPSFVVQSRRRRTVSRRSRTPRCSWHGGSRTSARWVMGLRRRAGACTWRRAEPTRGIPVARAPPGRERGVDLKTIQALLGHATPTMTHRYIPTDLEAQRRAVALLDHRAEDVGASVTGQPRGPGGV
jgi:hypothetical protein